MVSVSAVSLYPEPVEVPLSVAYLLFPVSESNNIAPSFLASNASILPGIAALFPPAISSQVSDFLFFPHPHHCILLLYSLSRMQYAKSCILQCQDLRPPDRIGSGPHRRPLLLSCCCDCLLRVLELQVFSLLLLSTNPLPLVQSTERTQEEALGSYFLQFD